MVPGTTAPPHDGRRGGDAPHAAAGAGGAGDVGADGAGAGLPGHGGGQRRQQVPALAAVGRRRGQDRAGGSPGKILAQSALDFGSELV